MMAGSLRFFNDDVIGAGNGAGGADQLTDGAPRALNAGDRPDNMVNYLKPPAGTNTYTQAAAIAFFYVYVRDFRHVTISIQLYVIS
jgi:hypothetical protein